MKHKCHIFIGFLIVALGSLAPTTVYARMDVTCTFEVTEYPRDNRRGAIFRDTERVRNNEAYRLRNLGRVFHGHQFIGGGGRYCNIRHRDNIRFGFWFDKEDMKLRPEGPRPSCHFPWWAPIWTRCVIH